MLFLFVLLPIFALVAYSFYLMGKVSNDSSNELEKVKRELSQVQLEAQNKIAQSRDSLKAKDIAFQAAKKKAEEMKAELDKVKKELQDGTEKIIARDEQIKSLYEQLKLEKKKNELVAAKDAQTGKEAPERPGDQLPPQDAESQPAAEEAKTEDEPADAGPEKEDKPFSL